MRTSITWSGRLHFFLEGEERDIEKKIIYVSLKRLGRLVKRKSGFSEI